MVEALVNVLKEKGLSDSRIGLDERVYHLIYMNKLKEIKKTSITSTSKIFYEIRIDCDLTFSNYYSDIVRTIVVGTVSEKLKKYYYALLEGYQEALNKVALE